MTARFVVRGEVQGVGYRYFVQRRADSAGLAGWVRNLPDGTVEIVVSGPEEKLAWLESELAIGPTHAHVSGVERSLISDEVASFKPFHIR
jgi:acylphosphatase